MSKNTKNLIAAIVTMLLWGSLFPVVKLGFTKFSVETTADILLFAGIRFTICGAAICIFSLIKNKNSYESAGKNIFPILLSGVFAIILHYGFTYSGLEFTESSKTALIKQVGAIFYVCFSFIFIKEDKPTLRKFIAALIGFSGIFVLNVENGGFNFGIGEILILCASFCTVFSNVISKKLFKNVLPITATGISQLFGGVVMLAIGLAMNGKVIFSFDYSLLIMAYICAASIVSYCLWFEIVKSAELSKLFIIKFTEPIFAAIFGAVILQENIFKIQYLIALILTSLGIWISNTKSETVR